MARKRYLKPGFFSNEELAELPFEYRLVFQGLWLWADREGRLEDRPKRLKGHIMPYDNVDFELAFQALADAGFIIRYQTEVNDKPFKALQILTFKYHQDVHVKEQHSTIPAPVLHGASTVHEPTTTSAETGQTLVEHGASPSLNLELDTSNLNLELEPVVDVVETRKREIENAIAEYCEPDNNANASFDPPKAFIPDEKEKNCGKKEKKPLPTLAEMIARMEETALWRHVLEHHKQSPDERQALFKIFYELKEDNYQIRLPSKNEIAQNFYNWIPIHLLKPQIQALNGAAIDKSAKHSSSKTKANAANDRISRNDSIADIVNRSTEFLQQAAGIDTT